MDTGTHVVMGVGLGGLATLDPNVTQDPVMMQAVMIATIVGSQAPDFDTVLKFKNNAVISGTTGDPPIPYQQC